MSAYNRQQLSRTSLKKKKQTYNSIYKTQEALIQEVFKINGANPIPDKIQSVIAMIATLLILLK